jgi:excisionase family DNA binding protein
VAATPKTPRTPNATQSGRAPRGQRPPRSDGRARALTTGQAAQYCLVSADTIANWIAAGRITAQRTAGGQYRIRPEDLRAFMRAHGMRTDLLDGEHRPPCWEFWAAWSRGSLVDGVPDTCADCPVRRGRAERCHELRPLLPGGTLRAGSCADCHYLATSVEDLGEEP